MKKAIVSISTLLVLTVLILGINACRKEDNQLSRSDVSTPKTNKQSSSNALVSYGPNVLYPYCTPGHGKNCAPGGFGCLIRYPQDAGGNSDIAVRFFEPVLTNEGETGMQIKVVFESDFPDIDQGILGPDQEGDDATIEMQRELVNTFGYDRIEIVNKTYYANFDNSDVYPHGYVMLDCIVHAPEIEYSLLGDYHNAGLAYLRDQGELTGGDDCAQKIAGFLMSQGFSDEKVSSLLAQAQPVFARFTGKLSKEYANPEEFKIYLKEIQSQAGFSNMFIDECVHFYEFGMQIGDGDVDPLVEYVSTHFNVNNSQWPKNDLKYVDALHTVTMSSLEYWKANEQQCNAPIKPGTWVIINDGIGAIVGLPLGGVGSILISTYMSAMTNEEVGT